MNWPSDNCNETYVVSPSLYAGDALCNYSCSYLEQGYYLFDSRNKVLDAFGNLFSWDLTQKYMPLNVIKNILSHRKE